MISSIHLGLSCSLTGYKYCACLLNRSFVELSQAGIRISSPKDLYAGLSDRLVTVVGTISEQMRAIDLILLKLSGNPYYTQSMNVPFSYAGMNIKSCSVLIVITFLPRKVKRQK